MRSIDVHFNECVGVFPLLALIISDVLLLFLSNAKISNPTSHPTIFGSKERCLPTACSQHYPFIWAFFNLDSEPQQSQRASRGGTQWICSVSQSSFLPPGLATRLWHETSNYSSDAMMMSKGWRCVDVCCIHPKILRDTIKIMGRSIEHFFHPYLKSWPKLPLIGTLEQHEEGWDRLGAVKAIVRRCRIYWFSGFLISWRLNCVTINMACHGCIMQSHMTLQIAVRINSGHHRPAL